MSVQKKYLKISYKFSCELCDYKCSKESEYNKHLLTRKHQTNAGTFSKNIQTEHKCKCGKVYKFRQGLSLHRKTCKDLMIVNEQSIVIQTTDENDTNDNEDDFKVDEKNFMELLIKDNSEIKNIVLNIVKSNTELMMKENAEFKHIILDMVKSNTELQKQMIDVCKTNSNINTNINCNNNSNNKTFNLQFFLNEQCKDAMNITDFANSFDLQLSDLESVGELGYVEGITKIMIDKLNSMDIYKRPIHCSDAKREIIYVKDADVWTKEEKDNPKLRQAIKSVSFRNMKLVYNWSNAYPDSKDSESRLNDKYMKLVIQSTGGNNPIVESENKIIRRIVKEIIIDKTLL
jgi:hypothetical protein